MARWLFVAGWALVGCASLRPSPVAPDPVEVLEISAHFDSEERATFGLVLDVGNPEPSSGVIQALDWEVWISGRWFAAGRQALNEQLPVQHRELELRVPVAFHRMAITPGPVRVEIGLRGKLEAHIDGSDLGLPFHRTMTVASEGAPIFGGSEED